MSAVFSSDERFMNSAFIFQLHVPLYTCMHRYSIFRHLGSVFLFFFAFAIWCSKRFLVDDACNITPEQRYGNDTTRHLFQLYIAS